MITTHSSEDLDSRSEVPFHGSSRALETWLQFKVFLSHGRLRSVPHASWVQILSCPLRPSSGLLGGERKASSATASNQESLTCHSLLLLSCTIPFKPSSTTPVRLITIKKYLPTTNTMFSLSKIILAATAILAAVVSASPFAQVNPAPAVNGVIQPIETVIPATQAYDGADSGPLPVPKTTASPTPSPRYTAPIKIVSDL